MSSHCRSPQAGKRSERGNVLVLTVCIGLGILLVIGLFALSFVRFLGGNQQQSSAIDAAALAAAGALGRIVIENDDFGFISISDAPPVGKATAAGDHFYLPVTSINTLLATVRLDAIIADKLDDNTMRECAKLDYQKAMKAKDQLVTALQAAVQPGGFGMDLNGEKVEPLTDAITAYQTNQVVMTDRKSRLVPDSMKLTLGCIAEQITCIQIPQPSEFAEMAASQQEGHFYKAYVNIPFKDKPYVFAGIADSTKLVDKNLFQTTISDLPYVIPTIVKCEADQSFERTEANGQTSTLKVHAVACAEPASLNDRRPTAGSLTLSLPDGSAPELTSLAALIMNVQVAKSPSDHTLSPPDGDYPDSPMNEFTLPVFDTSRPPFGQLLRVAFYDWIRRRGPQLNIKSLLTTISANLTQDASAHAEVYKFDADGNCTSESIPIDSSTALPVSQDQWYAATGLGLQSANNFDYDVYIRDYVFSPGRKKGGNHAGEPLGDAPAPPASSGPNKDQPLIDEPPSMLSSFPVGPAGGDIRPTYKKQGIAVDIRIRKRSSKLP